MIERIELPAPSSDGELTDDDILATYAGPIGPWLRVNFISSIDGASTRDGRSGTLGDSADRRVFGLLRRLADVVVVGAGTIRSEGYGGFRLAPEDSRWRVAQAMPEHPILAIVSGSLDLDPESSVFADAPVRPLIYTLDTANEDRRKRLEAVAEVVSVGASTLDPHALRNDLIARGLTRMHCEGGPRLFGTLINGSVVDELCLTVAPTLESGAANRIAHSRAATQVAMRLAAVLRAGDELFLRYVKR